MIELNLSSKLHWFALYVRVRHERKVEMQLTNKGFETFLPSYISRRKWSDRFKDVDLPLFPGYVFCRMAMRDRAAVLSAHGVVRIVGFGAQYIPVDDSEILALRTAIAAGLPCEPVPYVSVGERVRIVAGPLAGVEGIMLEFRNRHRLVLSITLLQRSVSVEVDRSQLECLSASAGRKPGTNDIRYRRSA